MTARNRRLFADVVRRNPVDVALACVLVADEAEPGTDVEAVSATLDVLTESARHELKAAASAPGPGPGGSPSGSGGSRGSGSGSGERISPLAAAEALRRALGEQAGFAGTAQDFDDLGASLLPKVLDRRHGLPILLSVVWLEVARRLGVPAYAVGLPGHVVVSIGTPDDHVLVDPFAGGRVITVHEAAEKVRATGTRFTRAQLAPLEPVNLLARILTNIRVLAAREDSPRTRLWAIELSLLLPHHALNLRRERGEVLVRLGDFMGGADELAAFADAAEAVEPAAAAAARQAGLAARARLN
jgi:regulator of sirC expression with transglutaminase-like and TPR domain